MIPDVDEGSATDGRAADSVSTEIHVPREAITVTAPSVGIFWRSPKPGAPPFVQVGDHIDPADTLCIVEVMKLESQEAASAVAANARS